MNWTQTIVLFMSSVETQSIIHNSGKLGGKKYMHPFIADVTSYASNNHLYLLI